VNRYRACLNIALVLVLSVGLGCSRKQRNEDFVPSEGAAKAALEAYLQAWSAGSTTQAVPETNPPVMVVDELRLKGRTLKGYKVLGQVPADAPLCFAVQLSLGNPSEEVRERYAVVGLDPLWVWRYDDYLMVTHWAHPMPKETDGKKSQPPKP
jgi:hypothetical protein